MVGTISDKGKKWIPRWWHTCVQGEKLPTRTLSLPWEAFPFLDLRSEGLSNLASLDQTSFLLLYDRGKWKFFPRHEKFVLICILSLYTCMSPSGDSFFSIFRGCSNHKSTIIIAQRFTHENKNLEFSKLIHKSKPIKPYPLWILKSSSSLRRRIFHAAQVHGIDQFNRQSNTLLCDRRPIGRRFAQN